MKHKTKTQGTPIGFLRVCSALSLQLPIRFLIPSPGHYCADLDHHFPTDMGSSNLKIEDFYLRESFDLTQNEFDETD